jgi:hypothetical protein
LPLTPFFPVSFGICDNSFTSTAVSFRIFQSRKFFRGFSFVRSSFDCCFFAVVLVGACVSPVWRWRKSVAVEVGPFWSEHSSSWFTVVKLSFWEYPWRFVFFATLGCVLSMGFVVYVLERELQPEKFQLTSSIYFTCVTLTTVGYGDLAPVSSWGRVVGAFFFFFFFFGICAAVSFSFFIGICFYFFL